MKRPAPVRRRSRSHAALFAFAFAASAAFVLVNVVDPYSGATASPYFRVPQAYDPADVQALDVAGELRGHHPARRLRRHGQARTRTRRHRACRRRGGGVELRLGTARRQPRPRHGPGDRPRDGARPRLGRRRVQLPRRPLEPRVGLERLREQRLERCLRHPAGASRLEDGQRRRRLGDQPGHPDRLGPRLHRRTATAAPAARGRTPRTPAGTEPARA